MTTTTSLNVRSNDILPTTMFDSRETPWGTAGVTVDGAMTSQEVMEAAGLNWEVSLEDVFFAPQGLTADFEKIPNNFAVTRSDNQSPLAIVGKKYTPFQNKEAFSFFDSLADEGQIKYEVAGTFDEGRKVWVMASFGSSEIVPNDFVDNYGLLYNAHDGSGAFQFVPTGVRAACLNMVISALKAGKDLGIKIRHTATIHNRIEASKQALGFARQQSEIYAEQMRAFAAKTVSAAEHKAFMDHMFPLSDGASKRSASMNERVRSEVDDLAMRGQGQEIKGVRGTAWGLYSGMTEWANYHRSTRVHNDSDVQAKRLEGVLMGSSKREILKATEFLAQLAA